MRHQHSRKGGFTLVEIIVVLVIITLISSIVFAAFKSVNEGNKKTTCQNNMVQIYQALRLYGQDFDGELPSYNPLGAVKGTTQQPRAAAGLGLWALYAYPDSSSATARLDCDGLTTQLPPTEPDDSQMPLLASYIKSPRFFHCPFDTFEREVNVNNTQCNLSAGAKLNTSVLDFKDRAGVTRFNPFYNSYQSTAEFPIDNAAALNNSPYSSFRDAKASRQLVYYDSQAAPSGINPERRTPDTTILTWCRFHRATDRNGLTIDKASNSDNVLFMDGTVQFIPTKQDIGTAQCENWKRAPTETVDGLSSNNTCPQ